MESKQWKKNEKNVPIERYNNYEIYTELQRTSHQKNYFYSLSRIEIFI